MQLLGIYEAEIDEIYEFVDEQRKVITQNVNINPGLPSEDL